jgi:hypothetical protein
VIASRLPPNREALGLPEKPAVDLAASFSEIARQDLRTSNILYEKKLYPQAIFELQQAVDKDVKAVGLLLRLVRPTVEDLSREAGHTTIFGILVRLPNRLAQLRRNLGVLAASEELQEGKELLLKLGLPWSIPDPSEMEAKLTDEQATKERLDLRSLKPRDLWKITLEFNPRKTPNPAILKLLYEAETQWKPLDKFHRLFKKKLSPLMTEPGTLGYILNIHGKSIPEVPPLAHITMWHERETRYPPIDVQDYWDTRKYNAFSGLIRLYPRLFKHAKRLSDGALEGARAAGTL